MIQSFEAVHIAKAGVLPDDGGHAEAVWEEFRRNGRIVARTAHADRGKMQEPDMNFSDAPKSTRYQQ